MRIPPDALAIILNHVTAHNALDSHHTPPEVLTTIACLIAVLEELAIDAPALPDILTRWYLSTAHDSIVRLVATLRHD